LCLIRIKTAAKNIFTIKKGNVENLTKSTADYEVSCIILMLDLAQGLFEIKDLNYFLNQNPFSNANMEGQLCYDFPSPKEKLDNLTRLNFKQVLDISILENTQVKKFRLLKMAIEKGNLEISKIIKAKMELEKLEELKRIDIQEYDKKIAVVYSKNQKITMTWSELVAVVGFEGQIC
jgi:hypothetical protein